MAAKHGLLGFARSLRQEMLAHRGIRDSDRHGGIGSSLLDKCLPCEHILAVDPTVRMRRVIIDENQPYVGAGKLFTRH